MRSTRGWWDVKSFFMLGGGAISLVLAFYEKAPLGFWAFIDIHKGQYTLFAVCIFSSCLLLFGISSVRFKRHYRAIYETQKKVTKEAFEKRLHFLELTQAALEKRNTELTLTQAAFSTYRRIHESILKNQKAHEEVLRRSLNISLHSRQDFVLTEMDSKKMLHPSMKALCRMAQGHIMPIHNEPISFVKILEDIRSLFGERIQRFNIMLSFSGLSLKEANPSSFQGDPVFVEFLLINIIGKALYRVPRNGKVSVNIQEKEDSLVFMVQDNGYSSASMTEEFVPKSFSFLLKDQDFQQLCYENEIMYEMVETTEELNIILMVIPAASSLQALPDNVIPIF